MNFSFLSEFEEFGRTLLWYTSRKLSYVGTNAEGAKSIIVAVLKARRGTYQKPFLHVGMIFLILITVISAPLIVNNYPTSASETLAQATSPSAVINTQTDISAVDTITVESEKPRRDVVTYTVQGGDTLSGIAKKFSTPNNQIDSDSIDSLNNFEDGHVLRPGDQVKIPPVSGVIVKVKSGDTVYSLAKTYGLLSAQAIADWPYNEFANDETFALTTGQTLVIPGGKVPTPTYVPVAPQVVSTPSLFAGGSGQFIWPVGGTITQYFSAYHPALDIAMGMGTPIVAADGGRVVSVSYEGLGYGNHIIVDHGNGYRTLYAHLSKILVSEGDNVNRGQLIGLEGTTGRSTGPHLHFEIYRNGVRVNPLAFLK